MIFTKMIFLLEPLEKSDRPTIEAIMQWQFLASFQFLMNQAAAALGNKNYSIFNNSPLYFWRGVSFRFQVIIKYLQGWTIPYTIYRTTPSFAWYTMPQNNICLPNNIVYIYFCCRGVEIWVPSLVFCFRRTKENKKPKHGAQGYVSCINQAVLKSYTTFNWISTYGHKFVYCGLFWLINFIPTLYYMTQVTFYKTYPINQI